MRMFSYADVMRLALQTGETAVLDPNDAIRLPRTTPPTQSHSAKTTGDRLDGHFEMFRNKDGERIFIGQDGQYIRRW